MHVHVLLQQLVPAVSMVRASAQCASGELPVTGMSAMRACAGLRATAHLLGADCQQQAPSLKCEPACVLCCRCGWWPRRAGRTRRPPLMRTVQTTWMTSTTAEHRLAHAPTRHSKPQPCTRLSPVPGVARLPMQRDGSQSPPLLPRLSSRMAGLGVGRQRPTDRSRRWPGGRAGSLRMCVRSGTGWVA